jgi:uncharacterized protein (TIGR03086 family)
MYERAASRAAGVARLVTPAQRDLPTPCREWDVRALLDHMATGPAQLLAAAHGDDTGAGWPDAGAVARCAEALRAPGVLEQTFVAPTGLILRVDEVAAGTAMDQLVHTWDLAVAIGEDRQLDEEVAEAIVARYLPRWPELSRQAGFVGPEVPVDPRASAQARLLGAMGRDPS